MLIRQPSAISFLLMGALLLTGCGTSPSDRGCTIDFSYSIGTVDPRFNITHTELDEVIRDALRIWSQGVDSIRIVDSPRRNNVIHLIYDDRQQSTDLARRMRAQIRRNEGEIKQMKSRLEQQDFLVEQLRREHERIAQNLTSQLETFNEWVESINAAGGFSQDMRSQYDYRRDDIQRLQDSELQKREQLNREAQALNRMTLEVNLKIELGNQIIDDFNREFGEGYNFNSGVYRGDGRRGTITIYHFSDFRELKVTLAHEIGHALGIGHVENSKSIMYELIEDQLSDGDIRLTNEDIEAIRAVCR